MEKITINSIDFGEIIAWIASFVLFYFNVISLDTLILFVLIKTTFKVTWS